MNINILNQDINVNIIDDNTVEVTFVSSSQQAALQFDIGGVALGSVGTVNEVDFTGSGVTGSRSGAKVTYNFNGGGGTPGGSDKQIQFNNGGSFGASSQFKIDNSSSDEWLVLDRTSILNGGRLIEIKTADSVAPDTPRNYGSFWHTIALRGSSGCSDGTYDDVYQIGFNQDGGGGNRVTDRPEYHIAIEDRFCAGGGKHFEYHLESTTNLADGSLKNRHFSLQTDQNSGAAYAYYQIGSMDWFMTNTALTYFSVANDGTTTITGPSGSSLQMTNRGATPGSIYIATGSSTSSITNNGFGSCDFGGKFGFISPGANGVNLALDATDSSVGYTVSFNAPTVYQYPFNSVGSAQYAFWKNENTNSSASADTIHWLVSNGGDTTFILDAGGSGNRWLVGVDKSDSAKYKIGTVFGFGSSVWLAISRTGQVNIGMLPSSASGLSTGDLWRDASGFVKAV